MLLSTEMSIRDFTFAANSGVSAPLRGKFLGSVESGAYLNKGQGNENKGVVTGIDHLKELKVTHIQLLPILRFCDLLCKRRIELS